MAQTLPNTHSWRSWRHQIQWPPSAMARTLLAFQVTQVSEEHQTLRISAASVSISSAPLPRARLLSWHLAKTGTPLPGSMTSFEPSPGRHLFLVSNLVCSFLYLGILFLLGQLLMLLLRFLLFLLSTQLLDCILDRFLTTIPGEDLNFPPCLSTDLIFPAHLNCLPSWQACTVLLMGKPVSM